MTSHPTRHLTSYLPLLRRLTVVNMVPLVAPAALPAHAPGRLSEVQVIDRERGEVLPLMHHKDELGLPVNRPGPLALP